MTKDISKISTRSAVGKKIYLKTYVEEQKRKELKDKKKGFFKRLFKR